MNINILSIGKFKNNPQKEIFDIYIKRLPWNVVLKELEVKSAVTGEVLKQKEGELLLGSIPSSAKIILLDEKGKNFSSKEFADQMQNYQDNGQGNLAFIIGGASGVSEDVKKKASLILSLGKLTFPHMMVRSILAEQLYRAYSIINNHPYHRE
jgi:23S rRNA (pseudouridine1915-N3)-methyltransferase